MYRSNFAWLFLVVLVSAGLQLITCGPVNTDKQQENELRKSNLPFVQQNEEALTGDPGSFPDDIEVPDRMYKRIFYTGPKGGSSQSDNEVPDRMYKRIFYTGPKGLVDNQNPENQRSYSSKTRPMDEKRPPLPGRFREFQASDAEQKLKALMALRDRAKAIHEDLAHSVLEQEALMENRRRTAA